MSPSTLIVSAADSRYFPLLRDLIASLRALSLPLPMRESVDAGVVPGSAHRASPPPLSRDRAGERGNHSAIACFDLGLQPHQRATLEPHIAHWATPGWDLPVAEATRAAHPELRALSVRPFLPRYFPGYDVYLWIDADAWVQRAFALEWYVAAAARGTLAAATHADRAYRHPPDVVRWRYQRALAYCGRGNAERLLGDHYYNAGVFALAAGAPHWDAWAKALTAGLVATGGTLCCDQTALNAALFEAALPATPLPATCNWLCHLAAPAYDPAGACYCEPHPPHHTIGILHLTGAAKDHLPATDGTRLGLRYPGPKEGFDNGAKKVPDLFTATGE